MASKKKHTVELTPQHVAEAIDKALQPFENTQTNEDVTLTVELSADLFKIAKATKFVSTKDMNADIKSFSEDVQAALVPKYMRDSKTNQMSPSIVHEILELEDNSDDGLYVTATVKIHGLYVARTYDSRKRHPFDYFKKVK